jgi:hypothetical protein
LKLINTDNYFYFFFFGYFFCHVQKLVEVFLCGVNVQIKTKVLFVAELDYKFRRYVSFSYLKNLVP